jgi:hypothetical protein
MSATTESHFSGAAMLPGNPVLDRRSDAATRESAPARASYTLRLFDTLAEVNRADWDAVVSSAVNPTFMDLRPGASGSRSSTTRPARQWRARV